MRPQIKSPFSWAYALSIICSFPYRGKRSQFQQEESGTVEKEKGIIFRKTPLETGFWPADKICTTKPGMSRKLIFTSKQGIRKNKESTFFFSPLWMLLYVTKEGWWPDSLFPCNIHLIGYPQMSITFEACFWSHHPTDSQGMQSRRLWVQGQIKIRCIH